MAVTVFRVYPVLGSKTNVPQDDPSLVQMVNDRTAITHDVGGLNLDYQRKRGTVCKAYGDIVWNASNNAQSTTTQALFQLNVAGVIDHIHCDNGKIYTYDGSKNPIDISVAATTLANDATDLYSIVQYGSYAVLSDFGEHTPYKWKHGDAAFTKLIDPSGSSGYTQYKFRYLEVFQRRIVGAYSDQTNGDIEIRWTDALPDLSSDVEFPSGNQAYKADDRSITGIKRMGQNVCYLYSDYSIDRIEYYPYANYPFQIINVIPHQGATNHHSIVSVGNMHFLFNRHFGFCAFDGSPVFPAGGKPISEDIENWIKEIDTDYYGMIVGYYIPQQNEICWTVPMGGESRCNFFLYYHVLDRKWRREDKVSPYIDNWTVYSDFTWNDLMDEAGGATADWTGVYNETWSHYFSSLDALVYATTGQVKYVSGNSLAASGTSFSGYRIEPIMDFGNKRAKKLLLELWFGFASSGLHSITVWHRGGNTEAEVVNASWSSIGTVGLDSPDPAILRTNKNYRLHQIKYGTQSDDEYFSINSIDYVFVAQGEW